LEKEGKRHKKKETKRPRMQKYQVLIMQNLEPTKESEEGRELREEGNCEQSLALIDVR
jgi:hypothetical protein